MTGQLTTEEKEKLLVESLYLQEQLETATGFQKKKLESDLERVREKLRPHACGFMTLLDSELIQKQQDKRKLVLNDKNFPPLK